MTYGVGQVALTRFNWPQKTVEQARKEVYHH